MLQEQYSRTALLLGEEGVERLRNASVAVFGIGGVGSFAAEALARGGVGSLTLIDPDAVSISNINRQLIALHSTVGKNKAEVMKARIADIDPETQVTALPFFYDASTADAVDLSGFDYVVDAIDTVSSKLLLIERAAAAGVPVISSMGAGNKLDPAAFEVADIYSTSVCPLARVMRRELKKRGIESLPVVYSREEAIKPIASGEETVPGKRTTPGSISFVPSAAGLILAGEVIRTLAKTE